jgi:type II secretory pathway pseudopilin PulG
MKSPSLFPQRQKRQGMVLLELVAALTIFTLVAFSLVMVLNAGFDAAKERNEIDAATRGLENQLALLHASRFIPVDQDLPDDGSGISYHVVIEPEQFQDQKKQPVVGVYRATVTAKWKSNGQEEDRSVSELLYQP